MKTPTPYAQALVLAQQLVAILAAACERIEIAGSLRRQKAEIGDIELVAIPRWEIARDLFGEEMGRRSLLDAELHAWPPISGSLTKNGERYKQFTWGDLTVDLFLVSAETWGVQLAIRTGSADFSHWLVTPQAQGGALPAGLRISEGRLWTAAQALTTIEEVDLFEKIGRPWIPPTARTAGRWRRKP